MFPSYTFLKVFKSLTVPITVVGLLLLIQCGPKKTPTEPIPDDIATVMDSVSFQAYGRAFYLQEMKATINNVEYRTMQIDGDNMIVSFYGSTPPIKIEVRGDSIFFGGHHFVVTDSTNNYYIDGVNHTLEPYGIHVFSNGAYMGRVR